MHCVFFAIWLSNEAWWWKDNENWSHRIIFVRKIPWFDPRWLFNSKELQITCPHMSHSTFPWTNFLCLTRVLGRANLRGHSSQAKGVLFSCTDWHVQGNLNAIKISICNRDTLFAISHILWALCIVLVNFKFTRVFLQYGYLMKLVGGKIMDIVHIG